MKKNKKLLMYFLAVNSLFTLNAASESNASVKYDKLYSNMIKNLETGKSNEENYKIIEKALNKRNRELKDLYNQSDYIVKPEYLEWQIFFSGFYTEKNGGDNTFGNAKYSSEVEGYYDATGTYVVTSTNSSTSGKPYQPLQTPKEIDLGMSIPMKQVNLTPISISPAAVAAPSIFSVSANITLPTAPVVANLSLPAFTPTAPVVSVPTIFTPPALDKVSNGFGQGAPVGFRPQINVMVGNASVTPNSGTTTITSLGTTQFSVGGSNFTWQGYNDGITSLSGVVSTGTYTMNSSSYPYTFLNALAGSYSINGNWEFRNQTTNPFVNNVNNNTARFISVNHAYGDRDKNTVFTIDNGTNIDLYGRTDGHLTVGIEYQSYDALPAKVINNGTITLKDGTNVFGMTIMIESYQYNSCLYRSSSSAAHPDSPCIPLVKVPLEESTVENRGKIVVNSSESIGIDFARYGYNDTGRPLTIYVGVGNIEINGSRNYGLRVPGVFEEYTNGKNYFNETVIDGSAGTITVGGIENVGVSLSKKITGSTLVTGVQGLSASNPSDIIGNIRNLNLTVNGTRGVGILRNSNFVSSAEQDIELTNGNVQSIGFGDSATESVLIRTDKYGVELKRDITVNNTNPVNSAINNVVMMSNDVNNLGSGKTFIKNNADITIGNNLNKTTGLLSINGGNLINAGKIIVDGTNSQGISVFGAGGGLTEATGTNTGTITVNGVNSAGVYNNGTFTMTGGTVEANGDQSVGIFAGAGNNKTNLNGGTISSSNNGISLFTGDNSTININGASLEANDKGLLAYTYKDAVTTTSTGHINITGATNATINAGGTAFYLKGDPSDITPFINSVFTGSGVLNLTMASTDSRLFILDSPSTPITLSTATGTAVSSLVPSTKVNIIGTGYKPYAVFKGQLIVDQNVDLDNVSDPYNRLDFLSSKTTVNSGVTLSGLNNTQSAIAQRNYTGTSGRNEVTVINNGTISQSGFNSIGIITDFGNIENNGRIAGTGDNYIGIYGANGTLSKNTGTIEVGNSGIGIYGSNLLSAIAPSYGTEFIEIENTGAIKSTGTTTGSFGIYAKNSNPFIAQNNSTITLGGTSDIDVSSAMGSVGVYAERSTITGGGKVTVGEKGIGMYLGNSNTNLNGMQINLNGNDAVGINLDSSTTLTGTGTFNINGERVVLLNLNSSTPVNSYIDYDGFTVAASPTSSYVGGNINNAGFYTNGTYSMNGRSTLAMGTNSVILVDSSANITAGNDTVIGTADGVYGGTMPFAFTGAAATSNIELSNRGTISAGDNSAVLYAKNNARSLNTGNIAVGNNSVGLYGDVVNSILNTGNITVGNSSKGIYLKEASLTSDVNTGKISSVSDSAIGIYSEYTGGTPTLIKTSNEINLSGDKTIGIYAAGTGVQNIENSGLIKIGISNNGSDPSIGIYNNNNGNSILNTGTIEVGKKSLAIYNTGGSVIENGTLNIGENGVGIYSDGGIVAVSPLSTLNIGNNTAIGVYGVNGTNIQNDSANINIGDGSYGFIAESGSNLTNNAPVTLGNNGVLAFGNGAGTITNNAGSTITANGSNNIAFYIVNGGTVVNNANIIANVGTGNIGIYNSGGSITNTGNISVGDSVLAYSLGMVDPLNSRYSVGIYGENSVVVNHGNIDLGKDAVGMYVKDNTVIAQNYGNITAGTPSTSKAGAVGILAESGEGIENFGNITLYGDGVIGIAGTNAKKIINRGIISVEGNGAIGIYTALNTTVENFNTINVSGTNGVGIIAPGGKILNQGIINFSNGASATQENSQYPLPDLINAGIIKVNGHFDNTGMNISLKPDLSTLQPSTTAGVDFTISSGSISANSMTITDTVKILPDFSQGTNAKVYKLEEVFITSNITSPTNKLPVMSSSLTWEATPDVNPTTGNIDVYMQKKDYHTFTDGLWFDDFGKALDNGYFGSTGDAGKIYDKIDLIETERDFRHVLSSLAGNVYANINQREDDIARTFENAADFIQTSQNNTKENVKVNVIAGKGKTKEDTDGVVGYDYTTTGVLGLREVERTYKHTFGYSLGYLHTGFEFKDGNESEEGVDTIQIGGHNKYSTNGWTLRNDLTGRMSFHNVDRNIDWGQSGRTEMNGMYETYSITSDNILGKEIEIGKNTSITPYGAFRVMYATRPSFEEDGVESLQVEGNDAWSVKPRVGIELKAAVPLGSKTAWQLKGALDIGYEYELADLNEREYARLTAVENDYHKLSKPQDEEGTFKTRANLGFEVADRYGIFINGEYSIGNNDQDDYRAGVTLKAVF